ncbi:Hydrophobin [Penicillium robsamsonii]|uniref:Hydrophobin n=1 Tax=Penicillium robsamsonii TaxID=1792511 RepID=UPI0025485829|nr:Hydrophobin [Penicillium robsamsonii]KAJ5826476.1 Hydrophobin [Penicillium robsamsonii]
MKFFVPAFLFAATAMAMPGSGAAAGVTPESENEIKNAVNQCGNGAKMSCCNKVNHNEGISQNNIGALANVLGAIGSEGLGIGQGCTQLDIPVNVLSVVGLSDFLKKNCQQNIACCQNSNSQATGNLVGVAAPCVSFGSLL